jgi:hypothetical protein
VFVVSAAPISSELRQVRDLVLTRLRAVDAVVEVADLASLLRVCAAHPEGLRHVVWLGSSASPLVPALVAHLADGEVLYTADVPAVWIALGEGRPVVVDEFFPRAEGVA